MPHMTSSTSAAEWKEGVNVPQTLTYHLDSLPSKTWDPLELVEMMILDVDYVAQGYVSPSPPTEFTIL